MVLEVPECDAHSASSFLFGLEIHHIVTRAEGGSHDPSNLTLRCSSCHTAHHEGRMTIRGVAPHSLETIGNAVPIPVVTREDLEEVSVPAPIVTHARDEIRVERASAIQIATAAYLRRREQHRVTRIAGVDVDGARSTIRFTTISGTSIVAGDVARQPLKSASSIRSCGTRQELDPEHRGLQTLRRHDSGPIASAGRSETRCSEAQHVKSFLYDLGADEAPP